MIYDMTKKKSSGGKCVKVIKQRANLKEAHERVPMKHERLDKKGRRSKRTRERGRDGEK